jgi:hypothetical protein
MSILVYCLPLRHPARYHRNNNNNNNNNNISKVIAPVVTTKWPTSPSRIGYQLRTIKGRGQQRRVYYKYEPQYVLENS